VFSHSGLLICEWYDVYLLGFLCTAQLLLRLSNTPVVVLKANVDNDRKSGVGLLYMMMDIRFKLALLKWYSALMVLIRFLIPDICVCTPVSDLLKSISYITKDIATKCHLNSEVAVLVCTVCTELSLGTVALGTQS